MQDVENRVSNECIQFIKSGFQPSNLDKHQASEIAVSTCYNTQRKKWKENRTQVFI